MNKYILKIYAVSLAQLIMAFIITSPIATLITMSLYRFLGAEIGNINFIFYLIQTSIIIIPVTSLPFIILFACPYVTALKYHKIKDMKYWFLGISGLALIFPIIMHVIKFIFLGVLGIYSIETAYFGIYVTLYVYYGVHTITALLTSVLMHRLRRA